jgi:hypothetical protein
MPPNHRHRKETEIFADSVSEEEGRAASRKHILDPSNTYVKLSVAIAIILFALGGVYGIGAAFTNFTKGAENTRKDVDELRDDLAKLKAHSLSPKELDIWAESMRQQNGNKIVVPKPSDYKMN